MFSFPYFACCDARAEYQLRPLCRKKTEHLVFHRSDHRAQVLVHHDVIEEVFPLPKESKVSLRVLEPVLDIIFGLPTACAKTVKQLAQFCALGAPGGKEPER